MLVITLISHKTTLNVADIWTKQKRSVKNDGRNISPFTIQGWAPVGLLENIAALL